MELNGLKHISETLSLFIPCSFVISKISRSSNHFPMDSLYPDNFLIGMFPIFFPIDEEKKNVEKILKLVCHNENLPTHLI